MTRQTSDREQDRRTAEVPERAARASRATRAVALAAFVSTIIAGAWGLTRLLANDPPETAPDGAGGSSASSTPMDVSGTGVGTQPFGTGAEDVIATVTARFGEPDLTLGPQRFFRIADQDGWFEVADDPISPSWAYPVLSVSCWGTLCLMFGGEEASALQLRGWELAQARRWSGFDQVPESESPDVRLAETGIRLGDSWQRLHAAYPDTEAGGAEGASLAVNNTPWATVTDGAAGWRLSGEWDWTKPTEVPAGADVTRLSAGEGPEPGCC